MAYVWRGFRGSFVLTLVSTGLLAGCGSAEKARVSLPSRIEPVRAFPPDIRTVAVLPVGQWAEKAPPTHQTNVYANLAVIVGPALQERAEFDVSGPAADMLMARMQQEVSRQGLSLRVVDRETFNAQLRERDIAMSDLVSPEGVVKLPGMAPVDALLVVKAMANTSLERVPQETFSVGDISRAISSEGRYVDTSQRMSVQRTITVSSSFRMTNAASGLVHDSYTAPGSKIDKAKPGFIAGNNMAEADLPPGGEVVQGLLDKQVEQFVGRLIGAETKGAPMTIRPSSNPSSVEGVRLLNSQSYPEAFSAFQRALVADPNDHQSAFGAGVACEMMGRYDEALAHYQNAQRLKGDSKYAEGVVRVRGKTQAGRAEPVKTSAP